MSDIPTPNDWFQLESLIDRVLDALPDQRAKILDELTAGNAARRAAIEQLVAECEQSFTLLERPVAERFAALLESELMQVPAVLAARYRVVRELGRGGMAVVYLAHDLKHEREVAVKIVRPELTATLGRARFLREIAIAAKLKHPHIVPLFDSGEQDGLLYYVMPYQEEQSLRERLKRDGALPVDDTIAIVSDVCDALAYAHQQGVVHRDIKPDNVLLSGRHALVTDFGVARAVSAAADQDTLTTAGDVVGTAAYMAPEQVSPHAHIDHRVDIYAVGVMAYEMLAGERPFSGDTPPSQRASHSEKVAIDLTTVRKEIPSTLAVLVMRCLAADPAQRYQSAAETLTALQGLRPRTGRRRAMTVQWRGWIAKVAAVVGVAAVAGLLATLLRDSPSTTPSRTPPRLAVLVFQHGERAELEPLAMRVTDRLIATLGDVPGLVVSSRSAVLPFRDRRTTIDSLGRALRATWVIDGRVYRDGDTTVALAQLTDAASGQLLESIGSQSAPGNDLKLIEDLVANVAIVLRQKVSDHVRVAAWRAGTKSDKALADMNRAQKERVDANQLAAANDISGAWFLLRRADSTFASASRADSRWSEPWIQRAWVAHNIALMLFGGGGHADSLSKSIRTGIAHAKAALQIDPVSPRAHEALGMLLDAQARFAMGDQPHASVLEEAEQELRRASDADTTLVQAPGRLAAIYYSRGEFEHAYLMAGRAYAADAFIREPRPMLSQLFTYAFEDQNDVEARRWCARYREMFPDDYYGAFCRLTLMMWDTTGVPPVDTARRIARNALAGTPEVIRPSVGAQLQMLLAGVLARAGMAESAGTTLAGIRAATQANKNIAREPFGSELLELEAGVRVQLGQLDSANVALQELLRRHPERRAYLSRSRRFSTLPIAALRDAAVRP